MALSYCQACLDKQRRIDDLEEEVRLLKARLRYQERTVAEGPFGSSTPSSKVPIKPSSLPERQARVGGGRIGHHGHGRLSVAEAKADRVVDVPGPEYCPHCGNVLEGKGGRPRTVLDCQPVRVERIVYRLGRGRCLHCGRTVQAAAPGVLPKCQYGNGLLAHVAVQHYLYGTTLGQLEKQTGMGIGGLIDAMHQLARWLKDVPERLIEQYRQSPVKHADETGWRNNGANGYAWLFCTPQLSVLRFRPSRSAAVVKEVLGEQPLPGVLVVDRYGGYNRVPCQVQYCYAHLLRDLEDLEKDFPDHEEIRNFVAALAPPLAAAMSLRGLKLPADEFGKQAQNLRHQIQTMVNQPDLSGHLPLKGPSSLSLGRRRTSPGGKQPGRTGIPPTGHRPQGQLRFPVAPRRSHAGSPHDRSAYPAKTNRRPRRLQELPRPACSQSPGRPIHAPIRQAHITPPVTEALLK